MFKNEIPLKYVEAERVTGTNAKGKDYDFANIKLSDGFESVTIGLKKEICDFVQSTFKRGDDVLVTVDVDNFNGRTYFTVVAIEKVKAA